jgi:cellulose synthase/poly-beta-1,6-N-acetylglucosamine synthase-like glycosyltransferase
MLVIALLTIHFGVPLAYFSYAKIKWLKRDWNVRIDRSYRSKLTIIVPTYNEAENIEKKLNNLLEQGYPLELLEIIVSDDRSTDETLNIVTKWLNKNPNVNVKIVENKERLGKIRNVFNALKHASGELVIITDADTLLERSAILNAVKYFADPTVGVLTASLKGHTKELKNIEAVYKDFYNAIRVAESKVHSTPIHNGALQAFRKTLIEKIPLHPNVEDCLMASYIAFSGYRAIQVDDVWAWDPIRGGYFGTKMRRAKYNIATFLHAKKLAKKMGVYRLSSFDKIWKIEWVFYIINPWLLVVGVGLIMASAVSGVLVAMILLIMGMVLLASTMYRTWIISQLILALALISYIISAFRGFKLVALTNSLMSKAWMPLCYEHSL